MTPGRALIVDDSRLARVTLRRALEKLELLVEAVDSGDAALQYLDRGGEDLPDVVFLDNVMPGMDGLTAVRRIRERYPDLPVVMCTSTIGDDYVLEAFEAGASGVVPKPAGFEALSAVVRRLGEPGRRWLTDEGAAIVAARAGGSAAGPRPGPVEAPGGAELAALRERLEDLGRRCEELAAHNEALLARLKEIEGLRGELRESILREARAGWRADLEAMRGELRGEFADRAAAELDRRIEALADDMEMRLATQISAQMPSEDALVGAAVGQARAIAGEVAVDAARAIANEGVLTATEAAQEAAREAARSSAEEAAATQARRAVERVASELEAAIGETRCAAAGAAERAGRSHWPVSVAALLLGAGALAAALLG